MLDVEKLRKYDDCLWHLYAEIYRSGGRGRGLKRCSLARHWYITVAISWLNSRKSDFQLVLSRIFSLEMTRYLPPSRSDYCLPLHLNCIAHQNKWYYSIIDWFWKHTMGIKRCCQQSRFCVVASVKVYVSTTLRYAFFFFAVEPRFVRDTIFCSIAVFAAFWRGVVGRWGYQWWHADPWVDSHHSGFWSECGGRPAGSVFEGIWFRRERVVCAYFRLRGVSSVRPISAVVIRVSVAPTACGFWKGRCL